MTPEQLAKLYGELDDACGFQPYRPRLVCRDGKVVGNCTVNVGPNDVNWYRHRVGIGFDGKIKVGGASVGWHELGWQWKHRIVMNGDENVS